MVIIFPTEECSSSSISVCSRFTFILISAFISYEPESYSQSPFLASIVLILKSDIHSSFSSLLILLVAEMEANMAHSYLAFKAQFK